MVSSIPKYSQKHDCVVSGEVYLMTKRTSVILSDTVESKLRKYQAKRIMTTGKSCSLSKAVNDLLDGALK
jgi:hypothetical protein